MEENETSIDNNESETRDQEIRLNGRLNDKDLKRKGQNYFSENPSGSKAKSQKVCYNDNDIDEKFKRYAIMIWYWWEIQEVCYNDMILMRNSRGML